MYRLTIADDETGPAGECYFQATATGAPALVSATATSGEAVDVRVADASGAPVDRDFFLRAAC